MNSVTAIAQYRVELKAYWRALAALALKRNDWNTRSSWQKTKSVGRSLLRHRVFP